MLQDKTFTHVIKTLYQVFLAIKHGTMWESVPVNGDYVDYHDLDQGVKLKQDLGSFETPGNQPLINQVFYIKPSIIIITLLLLLSSLL